MSYCHNPLLLLMLSACFCLTGSDHDVRAQGHAPDGYYLFGGPAVEQGHAAAVMPDGSGCVIAGTTGSYGAGGGEDILIIHTDAEGNPVSPEVR